MRQVLSVALAAGAVALIATAVAAQPQGATQIATSIDRYGVQADYRGPALDVG